MKAIDAAVQHAKWLRASWASMKPNSQVGEHSHRFDAVLDGLVKEFESDQARLATAAVEEKAATETAKPKAEK